MKPHTAHAVRWSMAILAIGLVTPSTILFVLDVFVGNTGVVASLGGILRDQFAEGRNLFLLALIGSIPFAALAIICGAVAHRRGPRGVTALAIGGLVRLDEIDHERHARCGHPCCSAVARRANRSASR
ncbi:MAG: hypothetical protein KIT73_06595 [Burkholderiales bacterium]|nr:hypothetical protein [Burkholderiales bacterium]